MVLWNSGKPDTKLIGAYSAQTEDRGWRGRVNSRKTYKSTIATWWQFAKILSTEEADGHPIIQSTINEHIARRNTLERSSGMGSWECRRAFAGVYALSIRASYDWSRHKADLECILSADGGTCEAQVHQIIAWHDLDHDTASWYTPPNGVASMPVEVE